MHLYTSDECHAWYNFICMTPVDLPGAHLKRKQMKYSCSQWDSNPQSWDLKSDALPAELAGLRCKMYYLNGLYVYMYFLYKCIHWYEFEIDEVECMLSGKRSVWCYILEYSNIVQTAKRRTSHVFAFNMQNTIKHSTWSGVCMLRANRTSFKASAHSLIRSTF